MKPSESDDSAARIRTVLQGYPEATVEAAVRFAATREPAALERLVRGVLVFHLPVKREDLADPAALPGCAKLVEELSVDSLTLVELSFLLEDVLGVRLGDEELRSITTVDELCRALKSRLGVAESR